MITVGFVHPDEMGYSEIDMDPAFIPRRGDRVLVFSEEPVWVREVAFDYIDVERTRGVPDVTVYLTDRSPEKTPA